MKEVRVSKIFNSQTGRAVIIAIDHGLFLGAIEGLKNPVNVVKKLIKNDIDAVIMAPGTFRLTKEFFGKKEAPARILTVDFILLSNIPGNFDTVSGYSLLSSVEQAIKWGFDAVKVVLIWGTDKKMQLTNIKLIADLATRCDQWEMPLMVEILLWGKDIPEDKKTDSKIIENACRIAIEIGADILKIPYTGNVEDFSAIVNSSPVPVVVLGGSKINSDRDILQTVKHSMDAGARGIAFGRNIWQHKKMDEMLMALKDIVHLNKDVDTVIKEYISLSEKTSL